MNDDAILLPQYPGYAISRDGRIYSFKSCRWLSNKSKTTRGYPQIHLYINGPKVLLVHRLVAEAWLHKPTWATEVNHKNGNKSDNHANNLEWTNRAGNSRHAADNGLMPVGENHKRSKLTDAQVREIRLRADNSESQTEIACDYPVSRSMVGFIARRENWKHVL